MKLFINVRINVFISLNCRKKLIELNYYKVDCFLKIIKKVIL